ERGTTFGGQADVNVPNTTGVDPASVTFAITGVAPNPAIERMSVSFALASDAPATLSLVDVAGRSVVDREVGSLGAGRHSVDCATAGRIPPGLYFLRLMQAGHMATSRVAVAGGR